MQNEIHSVAVELCEFWSLNSDAKFMFDHAYKHNKSRLACQIIGINVDTMSEEQIGMAHDIAEISVDYDVFVLANQIIGYEEEINPACMKMLDNAVRRYLLRACLQIFDIDVEPYSDLELDHAVQIANILINRVRFI